MPLIKQLVGVRTNDTSLPILQRDAIIDARTVGLFDAASKFAFSHEAGLVVAGSAVKDLVRNAPNMTLLDPINYDGKGFDFDIAKQRIALNNWKVPNVPHFALGVWFKPDLSGYAASAGVMSYRHIAAGGSSNYQWSINFLAVSGSIATILGILNGRSVSFTLNTSELHQVVFEYEVVEANHIVRAYVDGKLKAVSAETAQAYVLPDASDLPTLGYGSTSFTSTIGGPIYRAWLQRLDTAGKSIADIVALDYARNRARFV